MKNLFQRFTALTLLAALLCTLLASCGAAPETVNDTSSSAGSSSTSAASSEEKTAKAPLPAQSMILNDDGPAEVEKLMTPLDPPIEDETGVYLWLEQIPEAKRDELLKKYPQKNIPASSETETQSKPQTETQNQTQSQTSSEKKLMFELNPHIVDGKNVYFWLEQIPEAKRTELLQKYPQKDLPQEYVDKYLKTPAAQTPAQQTPAQQTPAQTPAPAPGSAEAVKAFGGRRATVETDRNACWTMAEDPDNPNPYDVTWDYGSDYAQLVASLNWTPVFDADFYMQAFPVLALQYNYRTDLLLKHFQTAGIHEGRQGSASFNVKAYMTNCDQSLRDAFGENYECYYIYYLMNYQTQKSIPATGNYPKQLTARLTALQKEELDAINMYRAEVGVQPIVFDSEMAALANYRAYTNAILHVHGHGWTHNEENLKVLYYNTLDKLNMTTFGENTVTSAVKKADKYPYANKRFYIVYRDSKPHYEAMINKNYKYAGTSNVYFTNNHEIQDLFKQADTYNYRDLIQFDTFTPSLSTALNP